MLTIAKRVRLTPAGASLNGVRIRTGQTDTNGSLLTSIYREQVGDYPKFFKMDPLCKLGFLASEILLRDEPERFVPRHDRAVVLFNRSGSFASDSLYQHTIADAANYYPSPAVFVCPTSSPEKSPSGTNITEKLLSMYLTEHRPAESQQSFPISFPTRRFVRRSAGG